MNEVADELRVELHTAKAEIEVLLAEIARRDAMDVLIQSRYEALCGLLGDEGRLARAEFRERLESLLDPVLGKAAPPPDLRTLEEIAAGMEFSASLRSSGIGNDPPPEAETGVRVAASRDTGGARTCSTEIADEADEVDNLSAVLRDVLLKLADVCDGLASGASPIGACYSAALSLRAGADYLRLRHDEWRADSGIKLRDVVAYTRRPVGGRP
jgi:hypothetical protein